MKTEVGGKKKIRATEKKAVHFKKTGAISVYVHEKQEINGCVRSYVI